MRYSTASCYHIFIQFEIHAKSITSTSVFEAKGHQLNWQYKKSTHVCAIKLYLDSHGVLSK